MLTSRAVEVTWTVSSSPDVTGYLISYTTTASYTSGENVTVSGNITSLTLTNLEENTFYAITVRAVSSDSRMSVNSNAVSVITYTNGKCYIISCQRMPCYNSTVPSSPPQNVMVTSIDPASLMVSWQLPPVIDHNGQLTGYVIQYTRVGSSDRMSVIVNGGTRQYNVIPGLVAYVNYTQ